MAMVVMGGVCVQSITAIHTITVSGYNVGNSDIYYYHGDGSDGRHVCTKYHGHTYYYAQNMPA